MFVEVNQYSRYWPNPEFWAKNHEVDKSNYGYYWKLINYFYMKA